MAKQSTELLPIGQAALRLGLTRTQLRTRVERHEIPGRYIDGALHVDVSTADEPATAGKSAPEGGR